MQYIELKSKLNDFQVFSLQDIKKLDGAFHRRRLNEWQDKGYIKKIRRGYYMFADQNLNEAVLFNIANKIYSPSYISFEMALSIYSLIPESVYGITSATTNKTNRFKAEIGEFMYHHLKPELMFGYELITIGGVTYKMAEIEKTVLDYFYINAHLKTDADFFELRFNADEFKAKADYAKFMKYLSAFNNKSLERRIKKFFKHINYADPNRD
jgi:predicted transcriptional regulator of viral defense system